MGRTDWMAKIQAASLADDPLVAEQEFIRKNRARAQAAAEARVRTRQTAAERAEQDILGLGQAQERGRASVRQQAAKALAYELGRGVPITSGANLAAGQQSAMDIGAAIGEYDVGAQQQLAAARQEQSDLATLAQEAEFAAAQLAAESGTPEQDYRAALAQAQADVNEEIENNKHVFGDDEEAMNRAIRQVADRQTDPRVRDWVLDQIGKGEAEGGWWNSLTGF